MSAFSVKVIAGDGKKGIPIAAGEQVTLEEVLRRAEVHYSSFNSLDVIVDGRIVTNPKTLITEPCVINVQGKDTNGAETDPSAQFEGGNIMLEEDVTVEQRLAEVGIIDPNTIAKIVDLGVVDASDLASLTAADLTSVGVPVVQARKAVAEITRSATPSTAIAVLPEVVDDNKLIEALKLGGVLKVKDSTVIAAVRVGLANQVGFFQIPEKLVVAMEEYADECEEQVPAGFYTVRKHLMRTGDYAEIFEGLPGCDGTYANASRKKKFLRERLGNDFWEAIKNSFVGLNAWQEAWTKGLAGPAMLALAASSSMGGMSGIPTDLLANPPSLGPVLDSMETLRTTMNRIFRGTGVQLTAALVYDAIRVKEILLDPELPAYLGVPNHEHMLKRLGLGVTADYARLETNLAQYVLGCLAADEQSTPGYFIQLYTLGTQVKWDML